MMLVEWSEFEALVRGAVGSCAEPEIKRQARNAAIEFCTEGRIWRSKAIATVTKGESYYVLGCSEEVGAYARVGGVRKVTFLWEQDGGTQKRQLNAKPELELVRENANWETLEGNPVDYFVVHPTAVRVSPLPDETAGTLEIGVFMKPNRTGTRCPEFLFQDYGEQISRGILSKVLLQQGKDWYDASLGDHYRRRFKSDIATVRGGEANNNTAKPTIVAVREFGF